MTVGETVIATVVKVGEPEGKGWRLTLIDVDHDAEPLAAALLPGGPPWLTTVAVEAPDSAEDGAEATVATPAPSPVETSTVPTVLPADPTEIAALQSERDAFLNELEVVRARVERLERSREQLRRQAREAGNDAERRRREVQSLTEELGRAANNANLFGDPREQLEFDVRLTWARRVPAAEKVALPLARYEVGPRFFESWQSTEGIDRQKVVEVVVEILTGRVHQLAGRETHQLRRSDGGNAAYVTRPDGSTCWRVALQVNAPQARRLHYWQRADGSVELSSVRQHDDFRP